MFTPHQTGRCTISVTDNVSHGNSTYTQNYTLASTRPLEPFTPIVPISLALPAGFPDSVKAQLFTITSLGNDLGPRIDADGRYTDYRSSMIDIYFREPTKILPNPTFEVKSCDISSDGNFQYTLKVQDVVAPDNTRGALAKAVLFKSNDDPTDMCNLNITRYAAPILLDKEVYVTFSGITGKNAFYYSPLEGIDTAQFVPLY